MDAVAELSKLLEVQLASMDLDTLANVKQLRPWLHDAVQRCVFTRVGQTLWQLYEHRHSVADAQYVQKARLLRRVSDRVLLKELGARAEFFDGLDLDEQDNQTIHCCGASSSTDVASQPSPNGATAPSSLGSGTDGSSMDDSTVADSEEAASLQAFSSMYVGETFQRAVAALSQIEVSLLSKSSRNCTPKEAIEALTFSQFEMKTCALEASSGQVELLAMDDIMPIFVFILVRSSLTKPFACASFMSDALSKEESFESEGRAVLLLESAARHIAHDWDTSSIVRSR
jgi:hypothetical protein